MYRVFDPKRYLNSSSDFNNIEMAKVSKIVGRVSTESQSPKRGHVGKMSPKTKNFEARRQRIADLLRAQVPYKQITEITGASKPAIIRVKRKLEAGVTLERPPQEPANKKRTEAFLNEVKTAFEESPQTSIRKMAKFKGVAPSTIGIAIKDVGMASRVRPSRQLLTTKQKEARVTKGKKVISALKKKPRKTVMLFSDKKNFPVDQAHNRRNDRVVIPKGSTAPPIMKTKHPASVMVLGVVASDGQKMPPHFFPCGLRVGTEEYLKVMRRVVKPWIESTYPDGNYIWTQDGAPGHTSKKTQEWLKNNLAGYWLKDMWPPNSPDINPLDYSVWGTLDSKVRATPHSSIDSLKASIIREWDNMTSDYIVKSCKRFRHRVEAIVAAGGGHIEGKTA